MSNLADSASRMHVDLLGKPHDSTSVLEVLRGKLDIKRHTTNIAYIPIKNNHIGICIVNVVIDGNKE